MEKELVTVSIKELEDGKSIIKILLEILLEESDELNE